MAGQDPPYDQIMRPVMATDATGAVVWAASYLPFGGIDLVWADTGVLTQNLRFPGQWFQAGEPEQKSLRWSAFPANGLHRNWHRDYDPTTGRYLQADPLGLVDGPSVYGYVRQGPVRWTDPAGELGLAGAAVGATINFVFQFGAKFATNGQDLRKALMCVDFRNVLLSGMLGAFGVSPVMTLVRGNPVQAIGQAALGAAVKKGISPVPMTPHDFLSEPGSLSCGCPTVNIPLEIAKLVAF